MNLHEYQGKALLKSYGVAIQEGLVAQSVEEAVKAFEKLQNDTGTEMAVIKAQIHAGGRGKGGGVKLAKNMDELREHAGNIIGMMLKTPQNARWAQRSRQIGKKSSGGRRCLRTGLRRL